ncbi:alpha/beta-hydrolase [Diplocarpon rosae]|nr:alpha/beta-hydrolase [Diplocarpon rosae]
MIAGLVTALAFAGAVVTAAPGREIDRTNIALDRTNAFIDRTGRFKYLNPPPTVDLGYAVHQATVNETGHYFNFTNIRYGAAPVGDLRFKAPIPPTVIDRSVNDGQEASVCAQGYPLWAMVAGEFMESASPSLLKVINSEIDSMLSSMNLDNAMSLAEPDLRQTEDCLFLDVIVPDVIFDGDRPAPVLVWVGGDGYVLGEKNEEAATLIAQSQADGGEGVVFVSINYRLGIFGFLSGSTFNEQGGVSNAGLLDQRLAFQWIQENIHLFGGDPTRVTVMGQSAGAGSIMHHITAYGGTKGPAPFSQAIIQSPSFTPNARDEHQVALYESILTKAQALIASDITDLAALRALDFETLANLNRIIIAASPYGTYTFGPTVDGTFVPKLPGTLLDEGAFDTNVKVMVSHNSLEGLLFASPLVINEQLVTEQVRASFPTADDATLEDLLKNVYPPIYDNSYPYDSPFERLSLIIEEVFFTCNTRYLNVAFQNQGYAYYFDAAPAVHGADIYYTFFNGDTEGMYEELLPVQPHIAIAMQKYLTNFAMSTEGNPNGRGLPFFPKYQSNSTNLVIDALGVGELITDTTANDRCDWVLHSFLPKL